jgi:NADH:ubiquinone oxidoreductase subunit K
MTVTPVHVGLVGVLGLMAIGLYGLLTTRSLIKLIVALQILVKSALLGLVLAGVASGHPSLGQSLAVTVIVADTIVAVVALALAIQVRRQTGTFDIKDLSNLRG